MRILRFSRWPFTNDFTIRAIKHPLISNLEILVPYSYRILYSGFENWFANRTNMDLDEDSIRKCNNRIIIVNLHPNPIDYIWFSGKTREQIIEDYKYIVANCSMITIYLNDDKSLYDVEVSYEVNNYAYGNNSPRLERIRLLHEEDKYNQDITNEKYS